MKPVDQTKFGFPHGDCFAACVASILERELSECVIFSEGVDLDSENDIATKKHWWIVFQNWLRDHADMQAVYLHVSELAGRKPQGYSILSGKGPRGLDHSTVALDGGMVHDPHPSRAGLLEIRYYVCFLPLVKSSG